MTRAPSTLDTRIAGSFRTRFWLELFGNSAHFPIANTLLELLVAGAGAYLLEPDIYVIALACIAQAWCLTRWSTSPQPRRLAGNLIGPLVYTAIESAIEGGAFFTAPHHLAYWGFSLAIGALQAMQQRVPATAAALLVVAENVARTAILFFMYALFEINADQPAVFSTRVFFADGSHTFIALAVLFLGLSGGLANLTASRSLDLVRRTTAQLQLYSEWLLGRDLLRETFLNPSALTLTRRERAVMFMDIRGFTRWSETQAPEAVVGLLDRYYHLAEEVLGRHGTIKFKLSADEVMAVFPDAASALHAAQELSCLTRPLLAGWQLGAGIGVHSGPVVEGLLGSAGVKFYDVIGDTVNTAKRIESAAGPGEVLVSQEGLRAAGAAFTPGPRREINAKGKEEPLGVYPLQAIKMAA
jgi:adenylate cyclase